MGLGNSKLNAAEGDALPAKILPRFVAKFDELKKHKNAESTLSKKKLLKSAGEEDGKSQPSPENESGQKVSSAQEIQKLKEEMVAQIITAEKLSRVAPVPNSEGKIMEEKHPNKDNTEQVNRDMDPNQDKLNHDVKMVEAEMKTEEDKSAKLEGEPRKEKDQEMGAKGDEHDDDSDEEVGRLIRPGSPSFRIYCIDPEKIKEGECCKMHQKTLSIDSVETATSTNSKQVFRESASIPKRKGNKKRFGAVRTLIKVRSCYQPMCVCTGDDKTLVTTKATK
ncbi:hypothetical protein VNO80_11662 [Phaseolus coccineus]|uniref:Uncharacterized protein n=1 Tax=Phaseolus coccineus TaxID=3886 RepID=A0AAN9RBL9_PHACN